MAVVCTACRSEYPPVMAACDVPSCRTSGSRMVPSFLGEVIDERYEVVSLLGSGAVSTVWLGVHVHTEKTVAIKILDREHGATIDKAFLHELRATSRADSAHTVAVYDGGRLDDRRFFITMEYVDGQPLREILEEHFRNGTIFPYRRTLRIAQQVCMGLSAAHRLGVIHQDLKPSNIVLTEHDGQKDYVKVLDFGFASLFGPQSAEDLVEEGFAAGTPAYIAPERLTLESRPDHRGDLYSLGIILFEMLTGQKPFQGETPIEMARARLESVPPPVDSLRPNLPPKLVSLVGRLLDRDPAKRPPTARAVLDELRLIHETPTNSILELERRRPQRTGVRLKAIFGTIFGALFGPA